MNTQAAYKILVFYGILTILTAGIGNEIDKTHGFTIGYVLGVLLSIVLWFTVGQKSVRA